MRFRLGAAAALAIVAALLACGAAMALTPASGGWKGRTAQNKEISFEVNPVRRGVCHSATCLASLEFTVQALRCHVSFGTFHGLRNFRVTQTFGRLDVTDQGRFSFNNTDPSGGKVSGSGTFTSESTVVGTIRYTPRFYGHAPCHKTIGWKASIVAPRAPSPTPTPPPPPPTGEE